MTHRFFLMFGVLSLTLPSSILESNSYPDGYLSWTMSLGRWSFRIHYIKAMLISKKWWSEGGEDYMKSKFRFHSEWLMRRKAAGFNFRESDMFCILWVWIQKDWFPSLLTSTLLQLLLYFSMVDLGWIFQTFSILYKVENGSICRKPFTLLTIILNLCWNALLFLDFLKSKNLSQVLQIESSL